MSRRRYWSILFPLAILCGMVVGGIYLTRSTPRSPAEPAAVRDTAFPLTITDALGRELTVAERPERIISLAPSITQMLFAIGADERVVAVTKYCTVPETSKLPRIGGYSDPNVEQIVALTPDLILCARGNPRDLINQMTSLGLTVAAVDPTTLAEVAEALRQVGRLVGEADAAATLADAMDARRDAVSKRTADLADTERPRVLFLFAEGSLFSAGPGSYVDEMINLAGGRNIAAETKSAWPELSMEFVVSADPQVILVLGDYDGTPQLSEEVLRRLRAQSRWRTVAAVKDGRVVVLGDDEIAQPSPRLVSGLEAIAAALHPKRFHEDAP